MPRYFFDIEDNGKLTVDEVGLELLTEKAVRDEAIRALPSIAQEELPDGPQHVFRVKVRDDTGSYIFSSFARAQIGLAEGSSEHRHLYGRVLARPETDLSPTVHTAAFESCHGGMASSFTIIWQVISATGQLCVLMVTRNCRSSNTPTTSAP